ncbi:MAG: glycosyltransferase [Bacteroidales bacterium]|nr:glycosyltransferase [Bacteroidales bacterium]
MRVGMFIDTWYPMVDGVIKVVDNYASRLVKYCDVTVFCPSVAGAVKAEDESRPYRIVRCGSVPIINLDYSIPAAMLDPTFTVELSASNLDIIHIHSPFSVGLAGVMHAKLHNKPAVATLHSQYRQDFERALSLKPAVDFAMSGVMRVFNSCNECWAVNAGIKDLYVNGYGLTAPCSVQLNATDHEPVKDRAAAARLVDETYGIPSGATVLLFVGRLNFLKKIDFIVRSLAIAKQKGLSNFRMLFVGQGQDADRLAALVKEQGLENEVIMCGLVRERTMLEALYSRAKLFLFPSLYDANSLVQIEAACQGTPTLFLHGARTGATVTENVNGYFSDDSEECYADKILEILADPAQYEKVSSAARKDLYISWDDVVKQVYDRYLTFIDI